MKTLVRHSLSKNKKLSQADKPVVDAAAMAQMEAAAEAAAAEPLASIELENKLS